MGKVKGVCAVCRVDADPEHFHTASHLERAAAWERKHAKEQAEARAAAAPDPIPLPIRPGE